MTSIEVELSEPLRIKERQELPLSFNLVVNASADGGNAKGSDLWDVVAFMTRTPNSSVPSVNGTSVNGTWASTGKICCC